ncbi:MAG: four helix bundle protein [Polyangiaceae bacterium]
MRDYTELKVWQKAHQLVLAVYRESGLFPPKERFGLTAHLRKTALSIPSNIAEGCGRETERDLGRFLIIASGSASELEYQLQLARDLEYLHPDTHRLLTERVTEVRRMLFRFRQSLATRC